MALNLSTFRTRTLTAIVFVIFMGAGLLINAWTFFLLFSIVHFGAWFEYGKLIQKINPDYAKTTSLHRIAIMVAGWCLMLLFTKHFLYYGNVSLTMIGFWGGLAIIILFPLIILLEAKNFLIKNIFFSLFGLLYISLPLALLVDLRTPAKELESSIYLAIPLLIIFSLWINDTMAYIVGSLIGKTPFSSISPKKTWEGTIGGVILTVAAVVIFTPVITKGLSIMTAGIIAAIAAVSGTAGDLFESKLKRMANVKDSGSFMPGHGGFLDRFDSLLFASIAVWLYLQLAKG